MVRLRAMNSTQGRSERKTTNHDEIIKSIERKPRKRGLKPYRGRGIFYKDHPMITCIHQRGNGMTYFDDVPLLQSHLDILCTRVQHCSTIFTDEYRAYDQLEEHGFVHRSVIHSQKEYANGIVHLNVEATYPTYG
jgi:transposase-like protein